MRGVGAASTLIPFEESTVQRRLDPSVPVLVLTGLLGSGKTSLLNYLHNQGRIPANTILLENDIGNANIDLERALLPAERKIALTSGCICCRSLTQLKSEVQRIEQLPPEAQPELILIETTGIAYPDEIKRELAALKVACLVLVTVDVAHFKDTLALPELRKVLDRGVAASDLLVLTWWRQYAPHSQAQTPPLSAADLKSIPEITRVLEHIEAQELLQQALSGKVPAKKLFFSPKEFPHNTQDTGVLLGDMPENQLSQAFLPKNTHAPMHDIPQGLSGPATSEPHSGIAAQTFHFNAGTTLRGVMRALQPFLEASGRIVRIKAAAVVSSQNSDFPRQQEEKIRIPLDVVQGELAQMAHANAENLPLDGAVNIISIPALPRGLFFGMTSRDAHSTAASEQEAQAAAERRLAALTKSHPRCPITNGAIQVDYHEDEAFEYADRSSTSPEARNQFYKVAVEARAQAFQAIQSGEWREHRDYPYYLMRLGNQGVWWLSQRAADIEAHNAHALIRSTNPAQMYFEGLRTFSDPNHLEPLKPKGIPWLATMVSTLVEETGDRTTAIRTAQSAFEHARDLDSSGTWGEHWTQIVQLLRNATELH
jgi:G3E family GTPase